jgi:hypothetical protein
MAARRVEDVVVIESRMKLVMRIASSSIAVLLLMMGHGQDNYVDSTSTYKKKVLDCSTLEILGSYYSQEGSHAAVSGGTGTEALTDVHPLIIYSTPLNDDDILTADLGISAYTSASSSNIDPFSSTYADPFQASSGASQSDTWLSLNVGYSHASDDRNRTWGTHISVASEYDYFSLGIGASHSWSFNKKNTELSLKGNVLIDTWALIYPIELRPYANGGDLSDSNLGSMTITGNPDYAPHFERHAGKGRNSYSLGLGFSQILTRRLQGSLNVDMVQQEGLLSTPFQRVYFADVADSFIQDFHLADDIERLPDTRSKLALGGRLHYYVNQHLVLRSQYRYYTDDWGIESHTATITLPLKLGTKITLVPSYRYYWQAASTYFAPYNIHLSTDEYYTSDYDLSEFYANRFGLGLRYKDIFRKARIADWGLEEWSLKYHYYERNTDFRAQTISFGLKFDHIHKNE